MFNKVPMQERRREGSIDCESEKVAGIQPSQQRRTPAAFVQVSVMYSVDCSVITAQFIRVCYLICLNGELLQHLREIGF